MISISKKPILTLSIVTIIFIVISEIIYTILTREIVDADINMVHREIETTDKLIFNGFLGQFFRMKHFGVLNLLIIPFLIKDVLNYKKQKQWEKAFLFLYLTILALIGIKGFFNPRYSLTIFPVSTVYLFYSIWSLTHSSTLKSYTKSVPYFLLFISIFYFSKEIFLLKFNDSFYKEHLTNQKYSGINNGTKIKWKQSKTSSLKALKMAIINSHLPDYKHNSKFYLDYPKYSQLKIFDFIKENHLKNEKRIMTNNLPSIYYYTNVNALYYWSGDDLIFDNNGQYPLFKNRNNQEVKRFLTDSMNVGYIYTYEPYNKYFDEFHSFLEEECDLIEQNYSTYQLFKIKEDKQ
ncbi:MAG: hypothetical protein J5I47_05335 [Vicingus serpentipes]|nr:hypothetical protein [Vicingus serpentipes]